MNFDFPPSPLERGSSIGLEGYSSPNQRTRNSLDRGSSSRNFGQILRKMTPSSPEPTTPGISNQNIQFLDIAISSMKELLEKIEQEGNKDQFVDWINAALNELRLSSPEIDFLNGVKESLTTEESVDFCEMGNSAIDTLTKHRSICNGRFTPLFTESTDYDPLQLQSLFINATSPCKEK